MPRRSVLLGALAAATLTACAGGEEVGRSLAARPSGTHPRPAQAAGPAETPSGTSGATVPPTEQAAAAQVSAADYPTAATQWGEDVAGVMQRLATDDPVVALTFDACGGPGGSGVDEALIDTLVEADVVATLFMNARWIEAHPDRFDALADDPRFEIANHGSAHLPLSVQGRSAYGITGTADPQQVIDEVLGAQELILARTGVAPRFFRSGTAYYDEVAVRIVNDLGLVCVNYDVLGDAGATLPAPAVAEQIMGAAAGSIVLAHMNQPDSGTAEGVRAALGPLRERGLSFVTLGQVALSD